MDIPHVGIFCIRKDGADQWLHTRLLSIFKRQSKKLYNGKLFTYSYTHISCMEVSLPTGNRFIDTLTQKKLFKLYSRSTQLDPTTAGSITFYRWIPVSFQTDTKTLLICKIPRTWYQASKIQKLQTYRGSSLMVWADIAVGGHIDLRIFPHCTVISVQYKDDILPQYVRTRLAAMGSSSVL